MLSFFISLKSKEYFTACLYTCYDFIRPDVALELAWKNGFMDFAFPFLIQVVREYTSKVDTLVAESEKKKKEAEKKSEQPSGFIASPEEMYANQIPQLTYYDPNTQQGYGVPTGYAIPPTGYAIPPTGFGGTYGQY